MEKEKKGLFGRLLEFWKEKNDRAAEGIGFWTDKEDGAKHFAEKGVVDFLSQRETQQAFWKEELVEKREKRPETEDLEPREKKVLFAAEAFLEKPEEKNNRMFFRGIPAEEKEKRQIVPVAEKAEKKEKVLAEEERPEVVFLEKEEIQTAPEADIERLMEQITKKLWEERESCGRRLR